MSLEELEIPTKNFLIFEFTCRKRSSSKFKIICLFISKLSDDNLEKPSTFCPLIYFFELTNDFFQHETKIALLPKRTTNKLNALLKKQVGDWRDFVFDTIANPQLKIKLDLYISEIL
jgi:hypothetical protein